MLDQIVDMVAGQGPEAAVRAVVEIVLLAYLIYQLFRELRGGRAVTMAVGVLLLVAAYLAAGWIGFTAIQGLLGTLAPYFALTMIIVFQEEIRSTLRELALHFVPGSRKTTKEFFELEDVVFAMTQLSQSKVGALIVVEAETGLRTFVQSGVVLEARLSSDLLISIFQRSSPLHDGGVILRNGKIAAAACFLPLTTSPGLAATLGTRHRAAIGISEESDALALVVSETDGRISIASGGAIERGVSLDRLRLRLIERLGPVVAPPRGQPVDLAPEDLDEPEKFDEPEPPTQQRESRPPESRQPEPTSPEPVRSEASEPAQPSSAVPPSGETRPAL